MIKIICVGKIKEKYFIDALEEYKKRLSKYTKLEIIEIKDESNEKSKKIEAENIIKHLKSNEYIITLQIEGNKLNSEQLAEKIDKILITNPNITFIIGGSLGLDKSVKDISNFQLSFSNLTFPHKLFRIMLIEQIYRSFKIINNETYHK